MVSETENEPKAAATVENSNWLLYTHDFLSAFEEN